MRYRLDIVHQAVTVKRRSFRLTPVAGIAAVALVWLASQCAPGATAQEPGLLPALEPGELSEGPPVTQVGGGSFYSQELGTLLRVRYNTESYGQDHNGNLDIGSMQVFNFNDAITFVDGQITLNDEQGPGFNVGLGCRWLDVVPFPWEPERMLGVSVWADGTRTEADNFFPQVGVSYESLGELWDLRANGYIPLGKQDQTGEFVPTGEIGFERNFLSELTQATVDHSLSVGELEVARRLGAERDAWIFAGGYALVNDTDETAGYRLGLRGYAYPDVMLQIAVSNDDLFKTNAAFSLIWFVGRTRSDYHPTCGLPDRFREPVLRNDYVAMTHTTASGGIPLTDPTTGDPIRFVHVNSAAPAGGTGTFENPYDMLSDINGTGSEQGDIVLAWAESQFSGDTSAILKNDQRLLGEGDGRTFTVATTELGTFDIPETSTGARSGNPPIILNSIGSAITLADSNEVANLTIDGGTDGIIAGASGAGDPTLHFLTIQNLTGDGIVLTPYVRDDDDDPLTPERTVAFNVTIDNVTFDDIAGTEMDINAFTTEDVTDPDVTLNETITLSSITSTNGGGMGLWLRDTHDGHTATITDYSNGIAGTAGSGGGTATEGVLRFGDDTVDGFAGNVTITNADIRENTGFALDFLNVDTTSAVTVDNLDYNGGAGAAGGIRADNFDGEFAATDSTLTGGTLAGVSLLNESEGTFGFDDTNTFDDIVGTTFLINGDTDGDVTDENDFVGELTVLSDFTSNAGQSVAISNIGTGADILFVGDITDNGQGLLADSNGGGDIGFGGDLTFSTGANTAITLTENADGGTDTAINFSGELAITTTTGDGFVATDGGNLTAAATTNSIETTTGTPLHVEGMTIGSSGVAFNELNVTQAGAANAIVLRHNTGGPITVGATTATVGETGTIAATIGNTIVITDSADVAITGLIINNTGDVAGVAVSYAADDDDMTVDLNDLDINGGTKGIDVVGSNSDTTSLFLTIADTTIDEVGGLGLTFDKVDAGTIRVNDVDIDGGSAAGSAGVLVQDSDASFTFDADTSITDVASDDFVINGGEGTISMAGDITNTDGTGQSIYIHDTTGGTITMSGDVEDTSAGIHIQDNTDTDINFTGNYTLNAADGNRVLILNNTDADISLTNLDITASGTGNGLLATGGGTLTITGADNTITTGAADVAGLQIDGMTIGTSGVKFKSVEVTGAAANGILLSDNTGGTITIGDTGAAAGEGGTIANTAGEGISITNTTNVVLNGVTVNDAGAAGDDAVFLAHSNDENMTVLLNTLTINTTRNGLHLDGAGGTGTFNVSGTGGTIEADETAIEVENRVSTASLTQDITNTAGRAIYVHNLTSGTVTHTGTVTDTGGTGVLIDANDDATVNLLGDYTLTTGTAAAFTVSNNTGTTAVTANNLDITTSDGAGVTVIGNDSTTSTAFTGVEIEATGTGAGFAATGDGNLTVTGNDNTINTATGTGLHLDGMNIVTQASFESVSSNGAVNGILLNDVTGATITVGDSGATAGAGGTIQNTTDAGVSITDTASVVLNGVTVQQAGNAAGEAGVVVSHTNATAMNVTMNDLTVTNTTALRNGVDIDGSAGSGTFSATVTDLDVDVTGDGFVANDGVTLTAGGTNTIETDTGVGLSLTDVTIGGIGASFQSVTVTAGTSNGIVMDTVTGGQVAVTGVGNTANSGGQLTTAGDAIVLSDVQNVDLNLMRIVNSGDQGVNIDHTSAATTTMDVTLDGVNIAAATNEGIHVLADNDANSFALRMLDNDISDANVVMDVTGAGHFGLLVDETTITTDSGGTARAFDLQFHDGADSGDVTIRNNSQFVAEDAEALFIDSYDAASKDIRLLVEDSSFTDNLGTELAADIRSRGNTLLQVTIQGNDFSAAAAAHDMVVQSSGTATSRIHLNLGGDATEPGDFNNAVGQGTLFVSQAGTSVFSIYQRDDTLAGLRNNEPVNSSGTFQNQGAAPDLPDVPTGP
jgi:hypothetical protein